jgi:O-antigen ligase
LAGTALFVLATAAGFSTVERDAVRLPVVAAAGLVLVGGTIALGIRRGELLMRREPVLLIGSAAWIVAAVSHVVHGADPAGLGPLTLGAAGLTLYTVLSRGLAGRAVMERAGLPLLAVAGLYASFETWRAGPVGIVGNSGEAGCQTAILAAALLAAAPGIRGGLIVGAAGAACAAATVWTGSRTGMIAGAAGLAAAAAQAIPGRALRFGAAAALVAAAAAAWPALRAVPSFEARLSIWKGCGKLAAEHPLLGVGPGRFRDAFVPYRRPEEFAFSHAAEPGVYREVNHAHSSYAQVLAETGWPGALLWVFFLYVLLRRWAFFMDHALDAGARWRLAGAGAGVVAFAVASVAYDLAGSAAHAPLFWILAAAIELGGNRRPMARPVAFDGAAAATAAAAAAMLLYALGMLAPAALAERALQEARRTADPEARRRELERAREWNGRDWRIGHEAAILHYRAGRYPEAAAELEAALRRRPNHVLMRLDLAVARAQGTGDLGPALAQFAEAERLAPGFYRVAYDRGLALLSRRRFAEARRDLERSAALHPAHGPSHFYVGVARAMEGDRDGARRAFESARARGFDVAAERERIRPVFDWSD